MVHRENEPGTEGDGEERRSPCYLLSPDRGTVSGWYIERNGRGTERDGEERDGLPWGSPVLGNCYLPSVPEYPSRERGTDREETISPDRSPVSILLLSPYSLGVSVPSSGLLLSSPCRYIDTTERE